MRRWWRAALWKPSACSLWGRLCKPAGDWKSPTDNAGEVYMSSIRPIDNRPQVWTTCPTCSQMSDVQNLHFEASTATASLQRGQVFEGGAGASLMTALVNR